MSIKEKIRIMVVDDMSTSRGLIIQALESFGFKNIRHAGDGQEALGSLLKDPVHLVLSDFNMPGMDGLQLLRHLRENKHTKPAGFILITGKADRTTIDHGRSLGMNNFILKPFTNTDLKACIETVIGKI